MRIMCIIFLVLAVFVIGTIASALLVGYCRVGDDKGLPIVDNNNALKDGKDNSTM